MSITLPAEGQQNWDDTLNQALTDLDAAATDAATDAATAVATANDAATAAAAAVQDGELQDVQTQVSTKLDKFSTFTSSLAAVREKVELNFSITTASANLREHWSNSKLASWWNEWGGLRGTAPYSWGDALVRAIRDDADIINNGNYVEISDRRTGAAATVMHGRKWADGTLIRNDIEMSDVLYIPSTTDPVPAATPAGTLIVRPTV